MNHKPLYPGVPDQKSLKDLLEMGYAMTRTGPAWPGLNGWTCADGRPFPIPALLIEVDCDRSRYPKKHDFVGLPAGSNKPARPAIQTAASELTSQLCTRLARWLMRRAYSPGSLEHTLAHDQSRKIQELTQERDHWKLRAIVEKNKASA